VPNHCENFLNERNSVYRPFPQAFPNAFTIEKKGIPNCQSNCPLEQKAQGYVALLRNGRFEDAMRTVRMDNPFPAICGRACHHPCMESCQRGVLDEPLGIPGLKRFLAEYECQEALDTLPEKKVLNGKRVAIVGAGPSGLSCAYFLALQGFDLTVYEALEKTGGMMTWGIPAYRLPREVITREIETIAGLGVKIIPGKKWGRDFSLDDLKNDGFDFVYLACGAWKGMKPGVDGEDDQGVMDGLEYLYRTNSGEPVPEAEEVVIVGGGNVAIDCARSALRRGAKKVSIYYRRSREEMPAREEEIEDAMEEGIEFFYCASPKRFTRRDGNLYLETYVMRLCSPDESGRRKPEIIPGAGFEVAADLFILAIGQVVDIPDENLRKTKSGTLIVDQNMETSRSGVFAGGDLVLGPATLVEAIAHGKRAASGIEARLTGAVFSGEKREAAPLLIPWREKRTRRIRPRKLEIAGRKTGFDEVEQTYTEDQALREAGRCLSCGGCAECLQCVLACQAKAVDHEDQDRLIDLKVGAVIYAGGAEPFDPTERYRELGYRRYPNVVTSLDFERILNASGPFEGKVVRPSDRRIPRKIAFVQCVGSRDEERGQPYCSSVCCMYAIKEALVAKEHLAVEHRPENVSAACSSSNSEGACGSDLPLLPRDGKGTGRNAEDFQATIFTIDLRAFGKDFEKYYERAKTEGIHFVRGKVDRIRERDNGDLEVFLIDEREGLQREVFDIVVLSVGLSVTPENLERLERLGLPVDPVGVLYTDTMSPVRTARDGVWTCGTGGGPKDIPDTVVEASAASCEVGSFLNDVRFSRVREKVYPAERDVSLEPLRIGVFVCRCGINIGGVVDVPRVAEVIRDLPGVVFVEENLYTCSQDTQDRMKELIDKHGINRVVVASCSPRTHEPLFRETLREAGINPYLFEMANIRDQCSWVHQQDPQKATEKASDLVLMSVAKASFLEALTPLELPVEKSLLVVGGGLTGMTAAREAARQGLKVYLVEKEEELGGYVRSFREFKTLEGIDVARFRWDLENALREDPRIEILTGATLIEVNGFVGNFESRIRQGAVEKNAKHGGVVIATGGREHIPADYLYSDEERVITQSELVNTMNGGMELPLRRVVMIQCVGSRDEAHPWCSKVCCATAIRNALALKEKNPDTEITILYRDIRTFGLQEQYYRKARERGVVFIRFEDDRPPRVYRQNSSLFVSVESVLFGDEVILP
ncbi:MAG TPA: FAD-dependent oxidoreductase, partial [Atribacteraceae bacterium]|nr:FAD-dependent oxidoreductase [Atribacteraceae bacterium]